MTVSGVLVVEPGALVSEPRVYPMYWGLWRQLACNSWSVEYRIRTDPHVKHGEIVKAVSRRVRL